MPAAIDPIIKQRVIVQYLHDTVSNIIDEWKKRVRDSDYESIRELSVFCKKQGITLNALTSCIRLNNYIQSLDANANESTLESLIVIHFILGIKQKHYTSNLTISIYLSRHIRKRYSIY